MPRAENVFTVSRRIPHHSSHSGYDELARYVGTPLNPPLLLTRMRGLGMLHRYFRKKSGMEWYDGLYAELSVALHMRKQASTIYHFLFAERDFRYLPKLQPDRRHKIICSFHATPEEFKNVMGYTEHLKSIDAAIVMASNQMQILEQAVGRNKVFLIPHGVDTEYFVPSNDKETSTKTCICVGHHWRDFDTLCEVAAILKQRDPNIRLVVVDRVFSLYFTLEQQRQYSESFAALGNVELCTNLTDDELLRLYQTSDLMVLPLVDTTANVAVLESLSCGLPLVVTDVGGIRNYIDGDIAAFAPPQDAKTMADHVIRLLKNREELGRLSRLSRSKALSFDWRVIAEQIKELYRRVRDSN